MKISKWIRMTLIFTVHVIGAELNHIGVFNNEELIKSSQSKLHNKFDSLLIRMFEKCI
jgi:hypothetical protein